METNNFSDTKYRYRKDNNRNFIINSIGYWALLIFYLSGLNVNHPFIYTILIMLYTIFVALTSIDQYTSRLAFKVAVSSSSLEFHEKVYLLYWADQENNKVINKHYKIIYLLLTYLSYAASMVYSSFIFNIIDTNIFIALTAITIISSINTYSFYRKIKSSIIKEIF